MKPILLATDGSPSAAEATRQAISLADEAGAPLVAVAVQHVEVPAYGYYGYAQIYSDLSKIEHEHALNVLEETAARADEAGVACQTVVADGPVVDEICRVARERDAGLIVIGAHGWGTLRRLVFGSVSLGVLHEAPCPVLIARGGAEVDAVEANGKVAAPA